MFSRSQHVFQNTAFFNDRNFLCPFGIICLFIIIIIISTEMISKFSWLLSFLLVICGAVQGSLRSMAYFTSFFFLKRRREYILYAGQKILMAKEIFSFFREHKIRIFELMCNENFPKSEMVNSKIQQVQLNFGATRQCISCIL